MVSAFGELTGEKALKKMYSTMLNDSEGILILRERPVINSKQLDLDKLSKFPDKSFGKEYVNFLETNNSL